MSAYTLSYAPESTDDLGSSFVFRFSESNSVALVPLSGGNFNISSVPLFHPAVSFELTSLVSISILGDLLDRVYLFPVIDGVISYKDAATGLWLPLLASILPAKYPTLGIKASTISSPSTFDSVFADGKAHTLSFVFAFTTDGIHSPLIYNIEVAYSRDDTHTPVSFTRVYGYFATGQGLSVPSEFSIRINQRGIIYGGETVISSESVMVEVDLTTGYWEAYLPDTDSMSDSLAAYGFYFDRAIPIMRRVPKTGSIPFSNLPVVSTPL